MARFLLISTIIFGSWAGFATKSLVGKDSNRLEVQKEVIHLGRMLDPKEVRQEVAKEIEEKEKEKEKENEKNFETYQDEAPSEALKEEKFESDSSSGQQD